MSAPTSPPSAKRLAHLILRHFPGRDEPGRANSTDFVRDLARAHPQLVHLAVWRIKDAFCLELARLVKRVLPPTSPTDPSSLQVVQAILTDFGLVRRSGPSVPAWLQGTFSQRAQPGGTEEDLATFIDDSWEWVPEATEGVATTVTQG